MMGKYFSIKNVFKIIFIIIALILANYILLQFSSAISITGDNPVSIDLESRQNTKDEDAAMINKSSSMAVMEATTLKVLRGNNINTRLEMASTTKVMTALVALENSSLDTEVAIADEAVGVEGSSIYLKKGEIWTIRDLLHGLMLRSGNDAATALAIAVGGSLDGFVKMMNDRAAQLGLTDTHFDNPHGLHSDNHYTSAYDLAVISSLAMRNCEFKKIVGCKMYTAQANSTHPTYHFANKNKMLSLYDGANGVKTGYTKDSGRCLVSAAERGGMQLVCVVLNIYDTYGVCSSSLDEAFKNYRSVSIGKSGDILDTLSFDGQNYNIALQNQLTLPLKEGEIMGMECYFDVSEELQAPLKANSVIGKLKFYNDNRLLFSANIVNMEEINDIGVLRKLSAYTGDWRVCSENGEIKQIFGFVGGGVASGS